MLETLEKLRPDRDLQCYFEHPSAIAAMSHASPSGFTVSGCWRQQFDWAVVEWNRDNVFEHPTLRNLPDGDLSGMMLQYEESRTHCIPMDSDLYHVVDWPYLRIWAGAPGNEQVYKVRLRDHATAVGGSYVAASAEFELGGTVAQGDFIGLAWMGEHHTHQAYYDDTSESVVTAIAASINAFSAVMKAQQEGTRIRVLFVGAGGTIAAPTAGAQGNRVGVYSYSSGSAQWNATARVLAGGESPTRWRVELDFRSLHDENDQVIPTNQVRKMRWTYAAELQAGAFERSEFHVGVTQWSASGSNSSYRVAGRGSVRYEDNDRRITYSGNWNPVAQGNYSRAAIRSTTTPGAALSLQCRCERDQELFLGTRYTDQGATLEVRVDGGSPGQVVLRVPGEDVLARVSLGWLTAGEHEVTIRHAGAPDEAFFFDFLEAVTASWELPEPVAEPRLALATDWDTDHSLALPAERTAWLIQKLGFRGRVNHYAGALWFYELRPRDHQYARGTVTFAGTPVPNSTVTIWIGVEGSPATAIEHLVHGGDTAESLAKAFELALNSGFLSVWAESEGSQVTIRSRRMGAQGNLVTLQAAPTSGSFTASASDDHLAGGADGVWITDVEATPRLNRAARDWSRAFFEALQGYGLDGTAAFSTEIRDGDTSVEAGIAQRYPDGSAVVVLTPAVQTNFSPVSFDFWKEVYREMAQVMDEAGLTPYLQFGEVQWWYFPSNGSGMPLYDSYTTSRFLREHGRGLPVFPDNSADPVQYATETNFLASLIGEFTSAIMSHVRQSFPSCRFEVLYPTDVNASPFNQAVNFAGSHWTPALLDCLKTESFTFTYARNLNLCRSSMEFAKEHGFPANRRSHLVGIGDETSPWQREARMAEGSTRDSVVLFALDQMCLIGYSLPLRKLARRSVPFD